MTHPPAPGAARTPTADPNVFVIPAAEVPPALAARVDADAPDPVVPRPAATVVLLRRGADGLEALLLRRHGRSGFAAGAWVFPGGVVDAADRAPSLAARMDGPSPAEWGARLGTEEPHEAAGYVACALREAFEETGILLARPAAAGLEAARRALLAGEATLEAVAADAGVRLAGDRLAYIAHWITPEPELRRYDTRFFAAEVDDGADCVVHEAELVEHRWLPCAEAVARFRDGTLRMLPPTVHTLEALARVGDFAALAAEAARAPVRPILPRMRRRGDGVVIEVVAEG